MSAESWCHCPFDLVRHLQDIRGEVARITPGRCSDSPVLFTSEYRQTTTGVGRETVTDAVHGHPHPKMLAEGEISTQDRQFVSGTVPLRHRRSDATRYTMSWLFCDGLRVETAFVPADCQNHRRIQMVKKPGEPGSCDVLLRGVDGEIVRGGGSQTLSFGVGRLQGEPEDGEYDVHGLPVGYQRSLCAVAIHAHISSQES